MKNAYQIITPDNHPESCYVIDNRGGKLGLTEIADTVFQKIHDPRYSSVVVLRPQTTLLSTFNEAIESRKSTGDFYFDGSTIQGASESNDFIYMQELARKIGPYAAPDIREHDANNSKLHLDFGYTPDELDQIQRERSPRTPVAGITSAMSTHGGGTVIVDAQGDEISYSPEHRIWIEHDISLAPDLDKRLYQVPNGSIPFMRSKVWPQTHPPCLHGSPPRENDGDREERLVQVIFLYGQAKDPALDSITP